MEGDMVVRKKTSSSDVVEDGGRKTFAVVLALVLTATSLFVSSQEGPTESGDTPYGGFQTQATRGENLETPHFNLSYQGEMDGMIEAEAETLEEAFEGVTNFINFTFANITHVMITTDPADLTSIGMGFYGQIVARHSHPDEPEIHLSLSPEWSMQANDNYYDLRIHVATHEFVHAALGYMRNHHNVKWDLSWLDEGLATYYPVQQLSADDGFIRFFISDLLENDNLRDIQDIGSRHPFASGEGYAVVKYMIDVYGRTTFLDFLEALSGWDDVISDSANLRTIIQSVFGKTLDDFNDEWKEWLITEFVPGFDLEDIEKVPGKEIVYNTGWNLPSSAKKGKLVWVSDRTGDADILISKEDGTEERLITSDAGYDGDAKLDHNAEWVAFTSVRDGNYEIYKVTIDGDQLTRLTNDASIDVMGSWSSNGEMVFTSNRNGDWDIFVMNSDGSDVRELIATGSNEGSPAFSPKGDKVAFISNAGGDFDLYVADSDGSKIRQLTFTQENESFPSWSPDGKRIAYTVKKEYTRKLMAIKVESGSAEVLFEHPSRAGLVGSELGVLRFPVWSSDGDEVFVSYNDRIYSHQLLIEDEEDSPWIFALIVVVLIAVVALILFLRRGKEGIPDSPNPKRDN
jgi:TolB protein